MKVVHITTVHNPFDTRIFEKMCKSAVEAGWDVTLVAGHDRNEIVDGVKVISFPRQPNRLRRLLLSIPRAIRLASKVRADIYHIHDPELLVAFRFLPRSGIAIYDMHENMAASIRHKPWIPSWLRSPAARLWNCIESMLLRSVPVIFAEYSYQRDYPWVKCSEVVLNMPKSEQLVALKVEGRVEGKLVYVGTVSAGRGSLVTLRALEILQRRRTEVQFLCIGPSAPQHRAELDAFVSQKELRNVQFIGRMRSIDAWKLAAQCHIGLATVLPLPNYVESYPTKLFEYMAIGVPVIASNFELYKNVVETVGCGICVDPEDPEQIAGAIETILDNPQMASEMSKRGQNAALVRFRWDVEADKLKTFYSRLLPVHSVRKP